MAIEKVKKIKALLGFNRLKDADLITRLNAVHDGLNGNTNFTTPPVDLVTLKTNTDQLTADIAAAEDGGKKAVTAKNKQRHTAEGMLEQLAHYVEATCKNDLAIFTSSGFLAKPSGRTAPQPLAPPTIAKAKQGATGQQIIKIQPLAGAVSYEIRYAPLGPGNTPGTWTSVHVASSKAVTVPNLTPGTTYTFEARALGRLGFSDWSDPVNRMCT